MSKNSSAKYYQDNKERLKKSPFKRNIVVKDTKISQKMKNKCWLSIEKNIIKQEVTPYYNYKKLLLFRKIGFFSVLG